MAATKNSVKVTLTKDRTTAGAVRFVSDPESAIGPTNIYLKKHVLPAIGATVDTEEIELTISAK